MSFQAMNWATRERVGDPVLKLLLLVLANYANEDGESWYSQKRISNDTEIPERTLRRKLATLSEMGLIEITGRTREDGTKATSMIRLLSEKQPAATVADGDQASSGQIIQRPKQGVTSGQKGGSPAANMVAEQEPLKNPKESSVVRIRGREANEFFDDVFWPNYPPRAGTNPKEDARRVFIKSVTSGAEPGKILEGLRRLVTGLRSRNEVGTKYVPQAVTWLNRKGWLDDPEPEAVVTLFTAAPKSRADSAIDGMMSYFADRAVLS